VEKGEAKKAFVLLEIDGAGVEKGDKEEGETEARLEASEKLEDEAERRDLEERGEEGIEDGGDRRGSAGVVIEVAIMDAQGMERGEGVKCRSERGAGSSLAVHLERVMCSP
jgi:hypothetical protein